MNQPICIEIPALPDPQQLTLPGGVQIEHLNLMQIVQPALTPLVPLFDLVDAIVAVFRCLKAIPDALGPPPDPTVLAACLPDLAKKVDKLLRLVPQLSLPILVVQLVDLVTDTVRQARSALLHLQEQANQMVLVVARAAELNDPGLMAIAQCAQANLAQEAANVGKSLAAIGKLIGLINLFLGMLGGPQVPDVAQLAGQPRDDAVAALDALLATLNTVRGMLPAPRGAAMDDSPTGLLTPLRRDQKRDFASGSGPELLRSKVIQALATEGETPRSAGELPWRTAFGSGLHLLRHQRNDDTLGALAQVYVRDALTRWVPEVELVAVVVVRQDAVLQLTVGYREAGQPAALIDATITSLTVGVEHSEHRDESLIPLPVCAGCGSVEVLRRSADDEGDHPAPGTFGHLHRLLVDHLHAELVRRDQVAPAVRKVGGRSDAVLVRPLTADAIERWFPRGMKLELPL